MKGKPKITYLKKSLWFSAILLVLALCVAIPSFAWFYRAVISAYAPISSHESLYIGAGHIAIDVENDVFDPEVTLEDVRYLYLNGIDATDTEHEYQDFVFCVYGKSISKFKLQLAYTTNNQFTYEIYAANEASVDSTGAVKYITHDETSPQTYYYKATGEAITGTYMNRTVDGGETIADSSKHTATYGSYSSSKVNRYAEPIYWQTDSTITGNSSHIFVKYFILRVWKGDKTVNDRETDVICIAAKSSSSS